MNRLDTITNAAGTLLSSYNFDTRGNLTQRIVDPGPNQRIDTFTFDKANRLMASTVGGVSNAYNYDGLGRRVREFDTASTYFYYGRSGQLLYTNDLKTSLRHNHIYLAGSVAHLDLYVEALDQSLEADVASEDLGRLRLQAGMSLRVAPRSAVLFPRDEHGATLDRERWIWHARSPVVPA